MERCSVFPQFVTSEEFWQMIRPLLPKYPTSPKGGRPRTPLRNVVDAIFYCLRTGCQWKAIPHTLCSGSTAHAYFQEWTELGIFEQLWRETLWKYEECVGLDCDWQAIGGSMTKAPLGQEKTGPNPTDRSKQGVKRSLLTEAAGIPLGLAVAAANVHDSKLLEATIENGLEVTCWAGRPCGDHLCLDKAYDSTAARDLLEAWSYQPHIRSRGEERREKKRKGTKARRWVVERTFSWLNRYRRLLIRWEKKAKNYEALLHLAFAHIIHQRTSVLG